ncbi:Putative fluoride ion transporter CrcB [Baekduia alba]|uniref:fluoride efflux transporter CrcB n=1 Tax=Baekduia alba TaxID=2997333 RepID=UPI0023413C54|nr:fluoride efflux transporter CrcB [Baekduia alba]WCB95077.1 Putative fluoride ion transporter CrcB [Baekduia alba]
MSVAVVLGVGVLGGLGAVARFLLDGTVSRALPGRAFPFGTLAVNLSGALVLGVFSGAALRGDAYEIWGVGLVGGYTTFSTWMLESHRLSEERRDGLAALNLVGSVVLGVLAVWLGRQLG